MNMLGQFGTGGADAPSMSPVNGVAPGMTAGGPMTQDLSGMSGQWGAMQQDGGGMNPMMLAAMMGGMGGNQQPQQPPQMPMMGGGGGMSMRGLFSQLAPQVAPRQLSRTSGLLDQILGSLQ
ncbi:hypothetical protein GHR37_22225 [Achromobacter xylosoxidans]|nr:hypothetical protein [Achromobacter xylosoxidans]